jgi:hypothetical protein
MTSQQEWRLRAEQLARAVAPAMGIAHRCSVGDTVGLDHTTVRACLAESLRYFDERNKSELVASIEHLIHALERGENPQAQAAEVLLCIGRAYPNGK